MLKKTLKRVLLLVILAAIIMGGYFGDAKIERRAQMGRSDEFVTMLCKVYAVNKYQALGVWYTCLGKNFDAFRSYSRSLWYDKDMN